MIKFIPFMLNKAENECFLNFFDKITFRPLLMEQTLMVPWQKDSEDEFVFSSHTSIISKELLMKEMESKGLIGSN